MAWVYYSPNLEKITRQNFILDFLPYTDLAALWIKPEGYSFKERELGTLLEAFNYFYCILWCISPLSCYLSSKASLKINEKSRAFGEWPKLQSNVFLKKDYHIGNRKYCSDFSTLGLSEVSAGEAFFHENMFGTNSTVAFVKNLDFINIATFEPLVDIYFKSLQTIRLNTRLSYQYQEKYVDFKRGNYVNKITTLGGIATLLVKDTETCRSLIFLSKEETILQQAFLWLQQDSFFNILSEDDLSHFINRGIGLAV